jgi:2-C-methyl-D-erythritol 2,4-cyclodiphosphate synthase
VAEGRPRQAGGLVPSLRVGQGFDLHPLVEGRPLVLGGVMVPFERGLAGLGRHFPSSDPRWAGADSLGFCRHAVVLAGEAGWAVGNVAATVVCDRPRLGPHLPAMSTALAAALGVDPSQVQVTAKGAEGLGFAGRGDGIAALAVCLLVATAP